MAPLNTGDNNKSSTSRLSAGTSTKRKPNRPKHGTRGFKGDVKSNSTLHGTNRLNSSDLNKRCPAT